MTMKTSSIFLSLLGFVLLTLSACQKDKAAGDPRYPQLPIEVYRYSQIPQGPNGFNPAGPNPVDDHMATLGRVLFYETQLSVNNRVSCGSCHHQQKAFADRHALSNGFENNKTLRNTPAICNPGSQNAYFWDLRENNLQAMVTQPIADHIEMGLESPEYIVAKVKKLPYYESLFSAAFGDQHVDINRIGNALSHFLRSMVSVKSKYDEGMTSSFANFSEQELEGKKLFFESLPCGGCHGGENFDGWGSLSQNIGLEMDYADDGQPGSDWNTGQPLDGWFKVPSLRNVALTGPYMHDGRFATLEEVVEFYNSGIQPHPQLAFGLQEGWSGNNGFESAPIHTFFPIAGEIRPLRMNLTPAQQDALIAFINTLTDESITTDVKFSDPFLH
jgi:cytochrome c peroxidase